MHTNTYLGQRHIIKKYIELGGKKVVLGSDVHIPEHTRSLSGSL